MAAKPDWLPKILGEENFQQYHAYFDTFKHNHKAHSTIAYARLGASLDRVKRHCSAQNARGGLIPYNKEEPLTQKTELDTLKSDNIQDYMGENEAYYKVLNHFANLYKTKYGKDIKKMIKEEFPAMGDGPLVAAFHGIIQLAYGFVAESDVVTLEGFAFAFSQYSPFLPKDPAKLSNMSNFGKGSKDMLDVLGSIRDDKAMLKHTSELSNDPEFERKSPGNFLDWYCMAMLKHYSDKFLDWTDEIKLPEFFDSSKEDMGQLVKLLEWLEDKATIVYVKSEFVNQFFLLHGITASWCLRQVIDMFTYKQALHLIRTHITGILMVYASTSAPEFPKSPEDFWKGGEINQAAWNVVLKDAMEKDFEDHVPKVVQVMYEKWHANQNSPMSHYYIAGARSALDNEYNVKPFPAHIKFPNTIRDAA